MISFICDRRKCEDCSKECNHTSDISHAQNFRNNGLFFEEVAKLTNEELVHENQMLREVIHDLQQEVEHLTSKLEDIEAFLERM